MNKLSIYTISLCLVIVAAGVAQANDSIKISGQYPSPGIASYDNLDVVNHVDVGQLTIEELLTINNEFQIEPGNLASCVPNSTGLVMVTNSGQLVVCNGVGASGLFWTDSYASNPSGNYVMQLNDDVASNSNYFPDHGVRLSGVDYVTWIADNKIIFSPETVATLPDDINNSSPPNLMAIEYFAAGAPGNINNRLNFFYQTSIIEMPFINEGIHSRPAMTLTSDGNLGVGHSGISDPLPATRLEVYQGELKLTGALNVEDDVDIGAGLKAEFFIQNTGASKMAGFILDNNDRGMVVDENRDIVFEPDYVSLVGDVKYQYSTMPTASNPIDTADGEVLDDITGYNLITDSSGVATWQPYPGAPIGSIAAFALNTCPTGWSAVGALEGRLALGASLTINQGTVGGSLTHQHSLVIPKSGWGYVDDHNERGWLNVVGSGAGTNENHGYSSGDSARTIVSEKASSLPPVTALTYCEKINENAAVPIPSAPQGPDGEDGKNWVDQVCKIDGSLCVTVFDMFCLMNHGVNGCPS